jgi:hypothetical protein
MRIWIAAAVITCCCVVSGTAQSGPGQLAGSVVDANDETLPGVTVSIRGQAQRTATTNDAGTFSFRELPPGDYELRAALKGFATVVRRVGVIESTEPIKVRMRVGTSTGQIAGSTRDIDGVLLAGIFVEIASPALAEKYRATNTGIDGRYRFADLPDGTYSVLFTFRGFWSQRHDNVVVANGSAATVDAKMRAGGESEPVVVVGADLHGRPSLLPIVHRPVQQASYR